MASTRCRAGPSDFRSTDLAMELPSEQAYSCTLASAGSFGQQDYDTPKCAIYSCMVPTLALLRYADIIPVHHTLGPGRSNRMYRDAPTCQTALKLVFIRSLNPPRIAMLAHRTLCLGILLGSFLGT